MRRRRPKKREPRPPVPYVTLAEFVGTGKKVSFDQLVCADKRRVAEHFMWGFDDLPAVIRRAIAASVKDIPLSHVVNAIDKGYSENDVLLMIRTNTWPPL